MLQGKLKWQNQRILDALYDLTPEGYQVHSAVAMANFAAFKINTDPASPELSDIEFAWCVRHDTEPVDCLLEGEALFNSLSPTLQEWFFGAIKALEKDVEPSNGLSTTVVMSPSSKFVVVTPGDCRAKVYYLRRTDTRFMKPMVPAVELDNLIGEIEDHFLRLETEDERGEFVEQLIQHVFNEYTNR